MFRGPEGPRSHRSTGVSQWLISAWGSLAREYRGSPNDQLNASPLPPLNSLIPLPKLPNL